MLSYLIIAFVCIFIEMVRPGVWNSGASPFDKTAVRLEVDTASLSLLYTQYSLLCV
jgi:hypothetical protein